jgi:hypothetical protein
MAGDAESLEADIEAHGIDSGEEAPGRVRN